MIYRFARFTLDSQAHVLAIAGRTVPLPRKAVETLEILIEQAGGVVTKERLIERLWPDGFVEEGNLTQHVYVLRRAFRERGFGGAIETLPRRGYRFVLPLTAVCRPAPWRRYALAAALAVLAAAGAVPASRAALDPEGARLYAMGRYYWNLRTTASMLRSVSYFDGVIARAPSSPLGYAGLADAYTELADSCDTQRCARWTRAAKRAAHEAIAADPNSADALTSLAMVTRLYLHDEAASARIFRRAIELDPRDALAHQWYGNLLVAQGELAEGRRQLELAVSIDPVSTATYAWLARDAYYERRYTDAERYALEALALAPERIETTIVLGLANEAQGRYSAAYEVFQRLGRFADPHDAEVLAASVYAKEGSASRSRAILRRNAMRFTSDPYVAKDLILAYVTLGSYDTALKYLARLRFSTPMDRQFFVLDPRLDPVRHDRRFSPLI
jgi:DNA-binding winged helix-turn-helix (wHTH) protein/tetratricopeptide (TPR) repeat protein